MSAARTPSASGKWTLSGARSAKQDEFYTQLEDISNELKHYEAHLRGKVVLCNCDDPFESNFFQFFALKFKELGLRKLICTSYQGSPIVNSELPFEEFAGGKPNGKEPYVVEINEVPDFNCDGAINREDVEHLLRHNANASRPLKADDTYGGGDFRSNACVEILKQADIVVTNPPFSLFREYVAQLVQHGKRFLIIGPKNATTYIEIFKLIKDNQLWLGTGFAAGNAYFKIPPEHARDFAAGVYDEKTGLVKFRNVGWFTNMDHDRRHERIPLFQRYTSAEYPKYDNYDAIEVAKIADIPVDFEGAMGVPITFLDRYNPEQFEIVGSFNNGEHGEELGAVKVQVVTNGKLMNWNGPAVNRKPLFKRIVIRRKN